MLSFQKLCFEEVLVEQAVVRAARQPVLCGLMLGGASVYRRAVNELSKMAIKSHFFKSFLIAVVSSNCIEMEKLLFLFCTLSFFTLLNKC